MDVSENPACSLVSPEHTHWARDELNLTVDLYRPHHSSSALLMSIFLQWTLICAGTVITTILFTAEFSAPRKLTY